MANTDPVTDTAEQARHVAALGVRTRPGHPRRRGHGRARRTRVVSDGRDGLRGGRPRVLRRRQVRDGRGAHATRAADRPAVRRGRGPALAGREPGHGHGVLPRGDDVGRTRSGGVAVGRRERDHRPRRRTGRGNRRTPARLPPSRRPKASRVVRWAKSRGIDVTAEATPTISTSTTPACAVSTPRSR